MPITSHRFGSIDPITGQVTNEDNQQFVSSVCWRGKSNMVVAANSSGSIKVLELVWMNESHIGEEGSSVAMRACDAFVPLVMLWWPCLSSVCTLNGSTNHWSAFHCFDRALKDSTALCKHPTTPIIGYWKLCLKLTSKLKFFFFQEYDGLTSIFVFGILRRYLFIVMQTSFGLEVRGTCYDC
jgi:hypothetical protein